ncbi:MAG: TolC family protein [Prevotella sp.]|nr:TolC family protein [Prevotella sp.]
MKNKSLFTFLLFCLFTFSPVFAQRIMTLEECVAAARKDNTTAKDARNDILMAKEQRRLARSKYFPTLSASAFHFRSSDYLAKIFILDQDDVNSMNQELETDFTMDDFSIGLIKRGSSAGLTLIEPVYTGGRISNYNKLAGLQVDARNLQQEVAEDQIVMDTEFLYYKILELHETDKTLDAIEKELENIHQDAINVWENGIVNKNDVLSVELAQDQLSALRVKARNGRNLLRRALAKHIGMPDEDIDVDTTLNKEIIAPERLLVNTQTAVENRSETRLLDLLVEKSVLERKIALADMLPVLAVGATASYSKFTSNVWNSRMMGFVGVQMPLSSIWSERHEYKRKKIEEQKSKDFRQDKRELISLQIQDAYDNLESTYKQVLIAEKSIKRAEENLRINREHYREGLTTMTVLLDAQRQQQQALTQHTSAVSEYLQAKTRYLILTGRRDYQR